MQMHKVSVCMLAVLLLGAYASTRAADDRNVVALVARGLDERLSGGKFMDLYNTFFATVIGGIILDISCANTPSTSGSGDHSSSDDDMGLQFRKNNCS